ncbi:hypothetical protein [Alcanivorax sp.]|uniref:hypothetical protein n=1 Tax=Alcanivorax sp. TaxID=1872427 RepID=UPI0025BE6803|nr:hypothetical protein [Alcanivorax sp.]
MSLILKYVPTIATTAKVSYLYRYMIANETKESPTLSDDSSLINSNDKLIHVESSHHIEPFRASRKDDKEYLKDYINEASKSFDREAERRMAGYQFKRTYSHLIVSPSDDEYGKHTPEELVSVAKAAFCEVYGISEDDFVGTIALHETNKNGVKMNDLHVAGCLINKKGKLPRMGKGFFNKIEQTARRLEKKFGFSPLKSSAIKKLNFNEKKYFDVTNTHKPETLVKLSVANALNDSLSFTDFVESLNENNISMKANITEDGKINGVSFLHESTQTAVKLSSIKNNYFADEKLSTDRLMKEFAMLDTNKQGHIELVQDQITRYEEAFAEAEFVGKKLKPFVQPESDLFPDEYAWMENFFKDVIDQVGESLKFNDKTAIKVVGSSVRFSSKSEFVLKAALLRCIELNNEAREGEPYKASITINSGSLTKKKTYMILEQMKAENPGKFDDIELTNYSPTFFAKKEANKKAQEARMLKQMRQTLSGIKKSIEDRKLDLSEFENPYKAYELMLKEKIQHPEKFISVEVVGHTPTLKQKLFEDTFKKEHYFNMRNNFIAEYREEFIKKNGKDSLQRNRESFKTEANNYADKKIKEHEIQVLESIKVAKQDLVIDINGNPRFFDNLAMNKKYSDYIAVMEENGKLEEAKKPDEFKKIMDQMLEEQRKFKADLEEKNKNKRRFDL